MACRRNRSIEFSSATWDIALSLAYGVLATCAALACAAILVACLLLPSRSGALPLATDYTEPGWQICLDWTRQDGKNAELADTRNNLGIPDRDQNALKEYEETLKTYRELARKDPETYLPHLAVTLNELGILDRDQNRMAEARKEYEEALRIYEDFAKQDPEQFTTDVQRLKKLLEELAVAARDKSIKATG